MAKSEKKQNESDLVEQEVKCAACKYWDKKDSIRARFGACTNTDVNETRLDPLATYQAQTRDDFGCICLE